MTQYTPAQARKLADQWPFEPFLKEALRSLADQVEELQAQLEAVGAGGVQRMEPDAARPVVMKILAGAGLLQSDPGAVPVSGMGGGATTC